MRRRLIGLLGLVTTASALAAGPAHAAGTTPAAAPPIAQTTFAITGRAVLKNLVQGTLPLTGALASTVDSGGAFTGNLTLNQAKVSLKVMGFLPVTATVVLVPTAPITGRLSGTGLSALAKVRIKLPVIQTGGLELASLSNCQTSQVSNVSLTSVGGFSPLAGGTLAGTFWISSLTGCGVLNGLVSTLAAGGANALTLHLGPVPPPTAG